MALVERPVLVDMEKAVVVALTGALQELPQVVMVVSTGVGQVVLGVLVLLLVVMEVRAQSESFGPAQLVHFHLLVQEICNESLY
jgi:hypothetical protein